MLPSNAEDLWGHDLSNVMVFGRLVRVRLNLLHTIVQCKIQFYELPLSDSTIALIFVYDTLQIVQIIPHLVNLRFVAKYSLIDEFVWL